MDYLDQISERLWTRDGPYRFMNTLRRRLLELSEFLQNTPLVEPAHMQLEDVFALAMFYADEPISTRVIERLFLRNNRITIALIFLEVLMSHFHVASRHMVTFDDFDVDTFLALDTVRQPSDQIVHQGSSQRCDEVINHQIGGRGSDHDPMEWMCA